MSNELALGIDLGGTKIYAIVTDRENHIVSEAKMSTGVGSDQSELVEDTLHLGEEALSRIGVSLNEVPHIGLAVPSSVDPATGDCFHAPNLGLKNFSLKEIFHSRLKRDIWLGNDGNLGILGEYHYGAGRGFRTLIGYYVGTGLGGGIIIDGKLHCGNSGLAGEFGHAIVREGGRRCGCGHRGCAEAYCSKIAFVKALKKEVYKRGSKTMLPPDKFNRDSRNIKSKQLAKAYAAGDPAVRKVVDKGAFMLGVAAASACAIVAPDCIILGGGVVSSMGTDLYPPFKAGFDQHLFGLDPERVAIRFSTLGDTAVAMGATFLARNKGKV